MSVTPKSIWLIGGTSDSATIAHFLAESNLPCVVTVTTSAAQKLYKHKHLPVVVGCMDIAAMRGFCRQYQIAAIVDASHPYAIAVSRQAIAVSSQLNLTYLRYERASLPELTNNNAARVLKLKSFEDLLAGNYLTGERVLLTVGCKALPLFQSWHQQATLFARILPKLTSLETAIAAGFTSDRLVAIRPPITVEMETALWQQWQISLVVTKASGVAGGEDIKRQVAANLDIPLVIIARPQILYPQQTSDINRLLDFCWRSLL
ncbi:MAG: cobalt-precorrin-6A reductase [Cyanobacteria bacterium J06623_7]